MKKKVLYISYDGMTDPLGQSQVIPYLRGLSASKYEFTILSFEKPARYQQRGSLIRELLKDCGIDWEPQMFSSKVPFLSKMYDQHQMTVTATSLLRKRKFDFIHCRSYVAAETGLQLKRKYGIPFIFDMRGFWVDERVDGGQWDLSKPVYRWLYKRFKKKEKQYFRSCSQLISLTHAGENELVNTYRVDAGKVTVIPCCVDLDHFDYSKIMTGEQTSAREMLGITTEDKVISYLGSLGGWYLTGEMLAFFKTLQQYESNLKFLFITPDSKAAVIARAAQVGINEDRIIVKEASRKEVPLLLSLSAWSIFFIKDAYSKKASSPTKQAEIMAMGVPVICNDIGDTGKIVEESKAGFLIRDFSERSFQLAAAEIIGGTVSTKEHIRNEAYKYFDLANGVSKYKNVYEKMAEATAVINHE